MFNLDSLRAEAQHQPFPFVLDGEHLELPHPQTLPSDLALALDQGELREHLPSLVGEDLGRRLLALPVFALEALLEQWLAHGGLQPGESPASTSS